MSGRQKRVVEYALLSAAILIGIWAITLSPTYKECAGSHYKAESNKEAAGPEPKSNRGIPEDVLLFTSCETEFLHKNEGLLTALATIFIAFFTLALKQSTDRLWVAGERQAKMTETALIADKRAFVGAIDLIPMWERGDVADWYYWRFRPVWRNSGDTPTRNLTVYVEGDLRNAPLPPGFNFNQTIASPAAGLIPPQHQLLGGAAPMFPAAHISPVDIWDIQSGKKFLYIWGWAKYSDVFENTPTHITRFCWQVLPTGALDPGNFQSITFPYILHIEGNCADEGCPY